MYKTMTVVAVLLFSFAFTNSNETRPVSEIPEVSASVLNPEPELLFAEKVENLYSEFAENANSLPALTIFERALKGYEKLENKNLVKNKLLTVIDFGLSSKKKRMWIMDMENKEVLYHTYVTHGKNTGGEFATKFSNTVNSLQSSLGFYVTAETYYGKNGLSLFIDGMEKGFNSNARKRYVVIHGSDYAEPGVINRLGRLGRSYGCPAVPNTIAKDLIHLIKGESVVFIHKDDENYLQKSSLLN